MERRDFMKKTALAKADAKKLMGKVAGPTGAGFGNAAAPAVDKREQRKRDQALGLVPAKAGAKRRAAARKAA